jgi:hypothetical protein
MLPTQVLTVFPAASVAVSMSVQAFVLMLLISDGHTQSPRFLATGAHAASFLQPFEAGPHWALMQSWHLAPANLQMPPLAPPAPAVLAPPVLVPADPVPPALVPPAFFPAVPASPALAPPALVPAVVESSPALAPPALVPPALAPPALVPPALVPPALVPPALVRAVVESSPPELSPAVPALLELSPAALSSREPA